MKPVNLLPSTERPRVAAQVSQNASTAVLGALGFVLVAVALWVLAGNGIKDKQDKIAKAKTEQSQAELQASALKAFGDFRQIKETRVATVKQLADTRFDWERFMRELALVLPSDVFLTEASSGAGGSSSSASTPSTSSADQAAAAGSGGVSVNLTGCAKSQDSVAETITRLRNMHDVSDVTLSSSTRQSGGGGSGTAASSGASGSGGQGCGSSYTFLTEIDFSAPTASKSDTKKVPSRLGGGA